MNSKTAFKTTSGIIALIASLITIATCLEQTVSSVSETKQPRISYADETEGAVATESKKNEEKEYSDTDPEVATKGNVDRKTTRKNSTPNEIRNAREIMATGLGLPPSSIQEPGRRIALARRAAKLDALRNLAEYLKVHIVSTSKMENGEITEDRVASYVDQILKNVYTISEKEKPDGSIEMTVAVRFEGDYKINSFDEEGIR